MNWVEVEVFGSLERLNISSIDAILLHKPEQLLGENGELLKFALQSLKSRGITKKIGISVYAPDDLGPIMDFMTIEIVQLPLNIMDRRFLESGCIKYLLGSGIEIHTRSSFLQGLLLMQSESRPKYFSQWKDIWLIWDEWLTANSISPLEACISFSFSISGVDRVILGIQDTDQLKHIVTMKMDRNISLPKWPKELACELIDPRRWKLD
jgi:aryl-alcohol dehydrogenase-like predicted oxidoreductase